METAAMRLAHTNNNKGRAYNAAHKVIAAAVPDVAAINTSTKTYAAWMARNKEAIMRGMQRCQPTSRS
jgi:hypothetical protein